MIRSTKTRFARATRAAHAAPTGGACSTERGWGCGFGLVILLLATPAMAEKIKVPSGQTVTLSEIRVDSLSGEPWARFRFVAPGISRETGRISHDVAAIDMEALCADFALAHLDANALEVTRIVVSLSDRAVEFGASDPDATQFFETFRRENDRCIWEEY
ncbi:MAG: DUF6497 family protein [Arenibacterium sp.]